ncbi:MAG: hypothetical protein WCA23_14480 [Stellaceae bacterium]
MQIRFDPVHSDVGDGAARREDILAQHKGRRHAHRFDRGIDAAPEVIFVTASAALPAHRPQLRRPYAPG